MHIDVHHRRIDVEEQHEGRMPAVEQHVAIGLAHRMGDQLVAHHAPVDVEVLQVRLTAREGRQSDPTPEPQPVAFDLDGQRLLQEGRPAYRSDAPRTGAVVVGLMQRQHALAVVAQMEGHIEARQRQALDDLLQVVEFGLLGAQELAPCRRVEKQITHFHRSAHRVSGRLHSRFHFAPLGFHLPGLAGIGGTRGQRQTRDGADRGQRFAAKAQAHDSLEIFQIANLAGGMAGQGQRKVVRRYTAAVVANPQQLDPALLDVHLDTTGAGVQAVLQQLLDHRGRAFDHLASGDLVRQPRAEQLDAWRLRHGWDARVVAGMFSVWPILITSLLRLLALRSEARLT